MDRDSPSTGLHEVSRNFVGESAAGSSVPTLRRKQNRNGEEGFYYQHVRKGSPPGARRPQRQSHYPRRSRSSVPGVICEWLSCHWGRKLERERRHMDSTIVRATPQIVKSFSTTRAPPRAPKRCLNAAKVAFYHRFRGPRGPDQFHVLCS